MNKPSVTNPNRPGYSQEERALLGRLYPQASQAEILQAFSGRTWESICSAAHRFGVKRTLPANYSRQWSAEHLELLRTHYPTQGAEYVGQLVGRKMRTVLSKAGEMGIRRDYTQQGVRQKARAPHPADWLLNERLLLAKLYPTAEKAEILAALPKRTWVSIQCQAVKQGLSRPSYIAPAWTEAENEIIRVNYPTLYSRGTAQLLPGRSRGATRKQAHLLGIKAINRRPETIRAKSPKAAPKPKKEAAARKPKPVVQKPAPAPVKRSPATPNLNAQAAKQQAKKAEAARPKEFVTAAEVQALSANHPARWAWTRAARNGPAAATIAFHQAMNELKQAA